VFFDGCGVSWFLSMLGYGLNLVYNNIYDFFYDVSSSFSSIDSGCTSGW